MTINTTTLARSTCQKPHGLLHPNSIIGDGKYGCPDDGRPTLNVPPGTVMPSRQAPLSTILDSAPTDLTTNDWSIATRNSKHSGPPLKEDLPVLTAAATTGNKSASTQS